MNPYILDKVEAGQLAKLEVVFFLVTEWDEFWSFVGKKSSQRWTWYVIERRSGKVLAYHCGRRTDEALKQLVEKVSHLPIEICHTDDWAAYERCLPPQYRQITGKDNTWRIERKNLNFSNSQFDTKSSRWNCPQIEFTSREAVVSRCAAYTIGQYFDLLPFWSQAVSTRQYLLCLPALALSGI